jgi:ATP-dependent protease ClpP protease subunit
MKRQNNPVYTVITPLTTIYDLFVTGGITDNPDDYRDHLEVFRSAGPEDTVTVHINSEGGSVFTALQYVNTMRSCEAEVHCIIEGVCMSAATFIFLAADNCSVNEDTLTMFHNYSTWAGGVGDEGIEHHKAIKGIVNTATDKYYQGFLTEEEILSIKKDNKTIWMNSEEVTRRLVEVSEATILEEEAMLKAKATEAARATLVDPDEDLVALLAECGFVRTEPVKLDNKSIEKTQ